MGTLKRIGEVPGLFSGNGSGSVLFSARDVLGDDEACSGQDKEGEHRDGGQDMHLFCNKDSKGFVEDGGRCGISRGTERASEGECGGLSTSMVPRDETGLILGHLWVILTQ